MEFPPVIWITSCDAHPLYRGCLPGGVSVWFERLKCLMETVKVSVPGRRIQLPYYMVQKPGVLRVENKKRFLHKLWKVPTWFSRSSSPYRAGTSPSVWREQQLPRRDFVPGEPAFFRDEGQRLLIEMVIGKLFLSIHGLSSWWFTSSKNSFKTRRNFFWTLSTSTWFLPAYLKKEK